MAREMVKDIKEICDDLLHDVGGDNKLDLLFGSVYAAWNDGYLDKKQRDIINDNLVKIANICDIKTGRDPWGTPYKEAGLK